MGLCLSVCLSHAKQISDNVPVCVSCSETEPLGLVVLVFLPGDVHPVTQPPAFKTLKKNGSI